MPIQLIACDIGGILVNIDKKPLAKLLGGGDQLSNFFDDHFWDYQRGQITSDFFISIKSQQFNIKYSTLKHTFQHMINIKNIKKLENLAVPYIFFSNINQLHFDFFLNHIKISDFTIRNSLISHQLGCLKPHIVFFDKLSTILDVNRAHILVVDDQTPNLVAAINYGFKAQSSLAQG